MLKILKLLNKKERGLALVCVSFVMLQVWLELELPAYMQKITILIKTPGSEISEILRAGGYMLLCALGGFACTIVVVFFASKIAANFAKRLRSILFSKVESFSMEEINRFSTASLITRSTNDITQIQMFLTLGLQMILKAPIMAVYALTKIAGKGFEWTLITVIALFILTSMITILLILVMPKFQKMQTLTDNLNRVTMESLSGLRVVRAYNAEKYQEAKFESANKELTDTHLFTSRGMSILNPVMYMLMSSISLSVYWVGAYLINAANVMDKLELFSNMVVFSNYAVQIIMSFMILAVIFVILPRATVSARRINEVLETQPSIVDGEKTGGLKGHEGEVVFKNVCFKYSGAADYVLQNVSFSVKKGETIAFIGSTGSGKSTLINLVPRFFEATEGEVFVSGVNVKDYKLDALHNKIGYVPQKAVLFQGSVSSNVAYGDNGQEKATEKDIQMAVKIAQGQNFVENMEEKYEGYVSQRGSNLSGGQKQRLAIARAIARRPEIYIFDDSFSALDYKTDRLLRTALKKETAGVTSMIVAQRIGTIIDADKIIVLDEGQVVGEGQHRELLKTCEVYKEIAMSQLSKEELAV